MHEEDKDASKNLQHWFRPAAILGVLAAVGLVLLMLYAKTVTMALQSRVDVVVEETFGDFGFSRQVLFGSRDGRAIYEEYITDDHNLMRALKEVIKERTSARNILITKPDSLVSVQEEVARLAIGISGAANAKYVAIAFNGGGSIDRRGKAGGHKNWSMRGFYRREGMYYEFLNAVDAAEQNVQDVCDAKP
jgi:hypothetical protein